jgi:hypothetical protein
VRAHRHRSSTGIDRNTLRQCPLTTPAAPTNPTAATADATNDFSNPTEERSALPSYRGYGSTFFLDRCYDLRVHHSPSTSSVVLEYSSEGRVVATGQPYANRYISVVILKDRKVTAWRDYLDPLRVFAALEGRSFESGGR